MKLKTSLFLISCFFILLTNCNQEKPLAEGMYRIHGTVSGLENGEVYLMNEKGTDTIAVNSGKFIFEQEMGQPVTEIMMLKEANLKYFPVQNTDFMTNFLVEPKEMQLHLDYPDFSKSTLSGSQPQADLDRLTTIKNKITATYQKEQEQFVAIIKKLDEAEASGASKEVITALEKALKAAKVPIEERNKKRKAATVQFIKDNPQSYVSLKELFYVRGELPYDKAKQLYDQLDPKYKQTTLGKSVATRIEDLKKGVVGSRAADFNALDIHGEPLKLSDFQGQYLLIDFWASWCVPCRKGNPHLLALYEQYKPKGLEILGIAADDDTPDAWRKAVEEDKIDVWRHILLGQKDRNPQTGIGYAYNLIMYPTKILVDPNGVIIGRYDGDKSDAELDKKLESVFTE